MFLKTMFGWLLNVIGATVAVVGTIALALAAAATVPDCGPWLTGEEYNACRDTPVGPGMNVFVVILLAAAAGVMLAFWGYYLRRRVSPQ